MLSYVVRTDIELNIGGAATMYSASMNSVGR